MLLQKTTAKRLCRICFFSSCLSVSLRFILSLFRVATNGSGLADVADLKALNCQATAKLINSTHFHSCTALAIFGKLLLVAVLLFYVRCPCLHEVVSSGVVACGLFCLGCLSEEKSKFECKCGCSILLTGRFFPKKSRIYFNVIFQIKCI